MPRVLERSMTFIDTQVEEYQTFDPILIGIRSIPSYKPNGKKVITVGQQSRTRLISQLIFKARGHSPRFYRNLKRANLSLLHGHFGWSLPSLVYMKRHLELPTIITFHGRDATLSKESLRSSFSGRQYLRHEPHASKTIDRVIAVSNFIRQKLICSGWDPAKVTTIHNGVDIKRFRHSTREREKFVLGIGRFVEKKGFIDLLKASAILKDRNLIHTLVLIGDGCLDKELRRVASISGLNVIFTGFVEPDEVRNWIGRASVVCVPSITAKDGDSEGLPTVLIEAQAMGTPVVATRHAGNAEAIIDHETGFLVEENSPHALAHYLERLLTSAELVRRMGEKGSSHITANFCSKIAANKVEQLYQSLLSDTQS